MIVARIMMVILRMFATPFLLAILSWPVLAQEIPQIPVSARFQRVNVRSGPGVDFTRIGQIEAGEQLWATGRSDEENNWLRVDFGNDEGWVAYFTMYVAGDAAILPIVESTRPQRIVREPDDIQVQIFRVVNVRREPMIRSEKIGQLFPGDDVLLLGRDSEDNYWLLIETEGNTGWIAYFTVTVIGDVNRLEVVRQTIGPDAPQLATADVTEGVTAHAFRTVNVRQGPGMLFANLGQLTSGAAVEVTGRNDADSNWLRIDYDGQVGWVAYFTVTVTGNPNTLPIIEQSS